MLPAESVILQVAPSDVGGGAEKVAADLHRRYLARGLDAWLAVAVDHGTLPNTVHIPRPYESRKWSRSLIGAAEALHVTRSNGRGLRWALDRSLRFAADPSRLTRVLRGEEDFGFPATYNILGLTPRPPGVLQLHNLHGAYFDIRALASLSAAVPTFLTLHDVWLLTGHCAYPMECERWREGCGDCPSLDTYVPLARDGSSTNRAVKLDAVRRSRLRVATPSRWLCRLVEESGYAGHLVDLHTIPNGVDTNIFAPGDRVTARRALGLDPDARVLLFSARSAKASPFKDFATLEAALAAIASSGAVEDLVMVAIGQDEPEAHIGGIPVRFVPFVDDPETVAAYYRAADIYVHPARAENFPLAVLEAMSCGVPVVASDAGGIPEMVADGETGLLFRAGDSEHLARQLTVLLEDPGLRARFSEAGAARARAEFTLELQVDRYLAWYESGLRG